MIVNYKINGLLISMLIGLTVCGCEDKMNKKKRPPYLANRDTGVHYYTGCARIQKPAVCSDEITESEAEKLRAYYKVHYNEQKLPITFEKYLDGKVHFRNEYIYSEDGGLVKIVVTDSEGKVTERDEW